VRVSAKRRKSRLKLTAQQVAEALTTLEFQDQRLVFMDAGLGVRRGELGALRWQHYGFEQQVFDIQHSYYWRNGGHLVDTKSEASAQPLPMHPAIKDGLLEWRSMSAYQEAKAFVFPSERFKGQKPLDLAAVLQKKSRRHFAKLGIAGVGWHTFRHTVGTMLAEMGEHQLTIRDYLRHSNLHFTNKYLQNRSAMRRTSWSKPSCRRACCPKPA
jgi:integrase